MSMTDIEFLNEMFPYYEDMTDLEVLQTASRRVGAEKMAKWKDEQSSHWHKVADGDLPEEGGNYWCKLKGKYNQGSSHYKQHCNNGYCILQWLPKKKAWNVRYNTEVEAWIELPKYNEE